MRKSRFSKEQIISILREQEQGQSTTDLCRRHGISQATFYGWKSKYGGLEVSEAKRLKALEEENRKLMKLLAEQVMDNATLKEMLTKNFWRLAQGETPWAGRSKRKTIRSVVRVGSSAWRQRCSATARSAVMTACCARVLLPWRHCAAGSATGVCT